MAIFCASKVNFVWQRKTHHFFLNASFAGWWNEQKKCLFFGNQKCIILFFHSISLFLLSSNFLLSFILDSRRESFTKTWWLIDTAKIYIFIGYNLEENLIKRIKLCLNSLTVNHFSINISFELIGTKIRT